jgi:hypothetical protein
VSVFRVRVNQGAGRKAQGTLSGYAARLVHRLSFSVPMDMSVVSLDVTRDHERVEWRVCRGAQLRAMDGQASRRMTV